MSTPPTTNVSAVLLAAGGGARLGGDKMRLRYKGATLFQRAVAPIVECPVIHELVVVVRPDARSLVEDVNCTAVVNDHWREGMGASLRLGVAAAAEDADALLVCLADMPEITSGLLSELIEGFRRCGKIILTPFCEGRGGHPVVFDAAWRGRLERLGGDVGARHLLRQSPDDVAHYETTDRAVLFDVDRSEDVRLRRIQFRDAARASTVAAALEKENIFHTIISRNAAACTDTADTDADLDADNTDAGAGRTDVDASDVVAGDGVADVGATVAVGYHAFDEARVADIYSSLRDEDA